MFINIKLDFFKKFRKFHCDQFIYKYAELKNNN